MMTILGCDDSVSQCEFVETPVERFVSIELCNAASEQVLGRYTNIGYPTAVGRLPNAATDITEALAEHSPQNRQRPTAGSHSAHGGASSSEPEGPGNRCGA